MTRSDSTPRRWWWGWLLLAIAAQAWATPYIAPDITGRKINDADFIAHTDALERVDALLRSDLTQPANYVLAGPTTGSAATPTWRPLVLADLPDDATAGKCLLSGGSGGGANPAWTTCPGGGGAFSALTGGTNTTAAMVVGTGASLTPGGTGTVRATDVTDLTRGDITTASGTWSVSNAFALLDGRSTPQTLSGGTAAGGALTLRATSNATPDTNTGFLTGAAIHLGETGKPTPIYASRGNLDITGCYAQFMSNDGLTHSPQPGDATTTFTMHKGTCVADATMVSQCTAVDKPWDCCTGAGTGPCGYCNGSGGLGIDCIVGGGSGECAPVYHFASDWWNVIDFADDGMVFHGVNWNLFAPTITGSGTSPRGLGAQGFLGWVPTYQIRSTDLTIPVEATIRSVPSFSRPSGTNTGTVTSMYGFQFGPSVSAGWTINDMIGFYFQSPANSGTIHNLIGIDIPSYTQADTLNVGIRSAMTAGANNSFIRHTGTARSNFGGAVRVAADTNVPTALFEVKNAANATVARVDTTGTQTGTTKLLNVGSDGATLGANAILQGVFVDPTIIMAGTANVLGIGNVYTAKPIIQTDGSARSTGGLIGLYATPQFDANGFALTVADDLVSGVGGAGVVASPVFSRSTGSSTQTASSWRGVVSGTSNTAVNTVGAGWTVTDWQGFHYNQPSVTGGGAITTQVALDIPPLSVAATNIGVRNADTTVYTPSTAQTIASAGTVTCDATGVRVQVTGAQSGSTTTAVADGVDGQLCVIIDVDGDSDIFTLDTQGANIRGSAATFAMQTGDTITLMYSGALTDWVELFRSNNT